MNKRTANKGIKLTKKKMNNSPSANISRYMEGLDGKYNVYKYYNELDDETINKQPKRCMCIDFQSTHDFNKHTRCSANAMNGSDFCERHQNCVSYLRNFLSGSEPDYQPDIWSNPFVEGSHNCYSYFLNRQVRAVKEKCKEICLVKNKKGCPNNNSDCSDLKPQPGDYELIKNTGSNETKERIYRCPQMQQKILTDNLSIFPIAFNQKCPQKYYKGAMVIDSGTGYGYKDKSNGKGEGNTYHFYRQDKDGKWSHKPGISPVTDKDADGKQIYVPHFANRDYRADSNNNDDDALFYNEFCGYYCIPTNDKAHKKLA